MFKIKICGVTRAEDVEAIAAAGADAIGINLVAQSPRCVSLDRADALATVARQLGLRVFVVVMNPSREELQRIVQAIKPDALQLHGHEEPTVLANCGATAVVKALSWTGRGEEAALAQRWSAHQPPATLSFLVDAYAPGVGGGTGRVARWDLLNPKPVELVGAPMLLAGGLTPENVARAIQETNCEGVDTASGVESAPGIKQKQLVESFVHAAQQAFRQQQATAVNQRRS